MFSIRALSFSVAAGIERKLNVLGFTEIDLDTLCVVLKRNTLRIREAPLFLAVLRWSVEECRRQTLTVNAENQRTVLGRALYMIRFPLMTIDEFAQHAGKYIHFKIKETNIFFVVLP